MRKIIRFSTVILAVLLIVVVVIFVGCNNGTDGADTTDDTSVTTKQAESGDDGTDGESETTEPVKRESGVDVTDEDEYVLLTKKAKMTVKIDDNKLVVTSITSKSGKEFVSAPAAVTFPRLGVDLTFKSAETYVGERNDFGYKFIFTATGIRYEVFVSAHEYFAGPFEFWANMYNEGKSALEVDPGSYFGLKVAFDDTPISTVFNKEGGAAEGWTDKSGRTFSGTGIYTKELVKNASAISSYNTNQDWNCGGSISMMYINEADEKHGAYIGQEWTNGKITAKGLDDDKTYPVSITVNLGESRFSTTIPAGKSMYFPSVYLGVYDGDMDDGSNDYKRWFLNCKAPTNMIENENEPFTQQDMQIGTAVASYGIQSIKWDYGWWTNESAGDWKKYEGLLEVGSDAYLRAMGTKAGKPKTLGDYTTSMKNQVANGQPLTLAMYVLLKDTGLDREGVPTSVGKYGHPEWFSDRIVTVCPSADLGNEECVKFYQQYMYDFFKPASEGGTGVTTWRSDFEPICRSSNKENRHAANGTDVQYWCTVGFGELVDHLIDNIEGFRYESCCSGGGMKDLFTMTKASVINCDDTGNYMSLHTSFYDSSYCIHPAQLQLPTNSLSYMKGSAYYTGTAEDYMYGLRCQMTGGVMLSNQLGTNGGWGEGYETDIWKNTIAKDYNKKIKPLIREGDLYHVLPRPDGVNWDAIEYADADSANKQKAVLMVWKPSNEEGNSKTIKLRGLDESKTYSVEFTDHRKLDCKMTGKELMETGLTIVFTENVTSDVIFFEEK